MKDGTRCGRDLAVALRAFVAVPRLIEPTVVVVPALWAAETLWPAQRGNRLQAGLLGGETLLPIIETRCRCLHRTLLGCGEDSHSIARARLET